MSGMLGFPFNQVPKYKIIISITYIDLGSFGSSSEIKREKIKKL